MLIFIFFLFWGAYCDSITNVISNLTKEYEHAHTAVVGGMVFFWTLDNQTGVLKIATASHTNGWSSVGFNPIPDEMDGGVVGYCANQSIIQVFLRDRTTQVIRNNVMNKTNIVGPWKYQQIDDYLICQFEWDPTPQNPNFNFQSNQTLNLIFAFGITEGYHARNRSHRTMNLVNGSGSRPFSICSNTTCIHGSCGPISCLCESGWIGLDCGERYSSQPELVHGVLMYIVWLFIFPLGLIFALIKRFVKETYNRENSSAPPPNSEPKPQDEGAKVELTFFWMHALTQTAGILVFFLALYYALVKERWEESRFVTKHPLFGYFIMAATFAQILGILFRPTNHVWWPHFHRWLGVATVMFAWCNVLPGLTELGAPSQYLYIHAIIIGCWFFVYLALNWFLQRWQENKLRDNALNFGLDLRFNQKWYSTFGRSSYQTE